MTATLSCKELVELVTEYLEGALPLADRTRFETHLDSCSGCRNYLRQIKQTISLTGQLTEATLEPQVKDELLKVFQNWKQ